MEVGSTAASWRGTGIADGSDDHRVEAMYMSRCYALNGVRMRQSPSSSSLSALKPRHRAWVTHLDTLVIVWAVGEDPRYWRDAREK